MLGVKKISTKYQLTGEAIDQISDSIVTFLTSCGYEKTNILRIRLSIEETLLNWFFAFGEDAEVRLKLTQVIGPVTIALELPGSPCDPFSAEDEYGIDEIYRQLLGNIGLNPYYVYQRGTNIVHLKLPPSSRNLAVRLLSAVVIGIAAGLIGKWMLSSEVKLLILHSVFNPLQGAFERILNAASGPVIALTVLSAICGMGSLTAMSASGSRLLRRIALLSSGMALFSLFLMAPAFRLEMGNAALSSHGFSGFLDLLLGVLPNDIITPFIEGRSAQMILISLILGYALLAAESRAQKLKDLVVEANTVGLIVAGWVSRVTPFFVALLLILAIWQNSGWLIAGLWKPILLTVVIVSVIILAELLIMSRHFGIGVGKLIKKMIEPARIAFRTGSVDESYGKNEDCCRREFGMGEDVIRYSLPLISILYMPAATIATLAVTIYAASIYQVEASVLWYGLLLILTVILTMATPPVAGIGLLTYTVIFKRLGIPAGALIIAMAADIILSFFCAAANQALGQLEMLAEADYSEKLNNDVLKN